jgi:hypothetical protein
MDLHVDRETAAFEALDQVEFPRRTAEVQRLTVQARDQLTELALAARTRQRGVPHVVLEIDLVLHPGGHRVAHPGRQQTVVPRRREPARRAQLAHQRLQVIRPGVRCRRERQQAGDVHRRLARLHQQPGCVQRIEPMGLHDGRV